MFLTGAPLLIFGLSNEVSRGHLQWRMKPWDMGGESAGDGVCLWISIVLAEKNAL